MLLIAQVLFLAGWYGLNIYAAVWSVQKLRGR